METKQKQLKPIKYWITWKIQDFLWFFGIAWHNIYFNECTKDFNCCCEKIGRFSWIKFKAKEYRN